MIWLKLECGNVQHVRTTISPLLHFPSISLCYFLLSVLLLYMICTTKLNALIFSLNSQQSLKEIKQREESLVFIHLLFLFLGFNIP